MTDQRSEAALVAEFAEAFSRLQPRENRRLVRALINAACRFADDTTSRLDLKIATNVLEEMAQAFRMFAAYRSVPKVTVFGSARVEPSDALYELAKELTHQLAAAGVMIVTGAGPGIMAAGNEGAGLLMSIGINIRLPFESEPNVWISPDDKLVEMKYFFTRKLMLMKESQGFLILPGGFGTMDESFELLTLLQTGKAEPAAIVFVDLPSGTFWQGWQDFVESHLYSRNLASPIDAALYRITDSIDEAVTELLTFHRNYLSRRFIGETMVMRLHRAPGAAACAMLTKEFADLCVDGPIQRVEPFAAELADNDALGYERIAFVYNGGQSGRLRQLIDQLNLI